MKEPIFIFCTVPDADTARIIGKTIVEKKLAACVSWGSAVHSVYRWDGRIEEADELNLTIKTVRKKYNEVQEVILSLHPYELPEIVSVPVLDGLEPYLEWIRQGTC